MDDHESEAPTPSEKATTSVAAPIERPSFRAARRWLVLWLLTYAAVTVAFKAHYLLPHGPAFLVALVPSVLGVVGFWRYFGFLRSAGEADRRAHVQALAWGMGGGSLSMLGYRLFERAGAPPMELNDPFLAMLLCWGLGLWLGRRR